MSENVDFGQADKQSRGMPLVKRYKAISSVNSYFYIQKCPVRRSLQRLSSVYRGLADTLGHPEHFQLQCPPKSRTRFSAVLHTC